MPSVILAKTVKGYGMGAAGESQNPTHQQKKLDDDAVRHFRDRFQIPIPDDKLKDVPYYHPGKDSPEVQYMLERRNALGGFCRSGAPGVRRSPCRISARSNRSPRARATAKSPRRWRSCAA
jgi:pyruvate dehydrogenase complex dehydrogenase (E1) component